MLKRRAANPYKSKAALEISGSLIFRVRNHRYKVSLGTHCGSGWALGCGGIVHADAQLDHRAGLVRAELSPALRGRFKYFPVVGADLDAEAEWIKNLPVWHRTIRE